MSDDLVEFLQARLNEDEHAAKGLIGAARHIDREPDFYGVGGPAALALWRRFNPGRVLAEVAAKRQVLELHAIVHREINWLAGGEEEHTEIPVCGLCVPKHSHFHRREDVPEGACATVRILAVPYANHADYCEEWKP